MQVVEAGGFDVAQRLIGIVLAERLQKIGQHAAHEAFLVGGHVGEAQAFEATGLAREFDGEIAFFLTGAGEQGFFALLAIQRGENLVRAFRLEPIDIAGVVRFLVKAGGGMSVENGAAEGRAALAVTIAAARAVTAGEHEFELAGARFAKQSDGSAAKAAVAGVVTVELLPDLLLVLIAVQFVENLAHHGLLVGIQHVADGLLHDVPVVVHLLAALVIPRQANRGLLRVIEAFVELRDERLGRKRRGRSGLGEQRLAEKSRRRRLGAAGDEGATAGGGWSEERRVHGG